MLTSEAQLHAKKPIVIFGGVFDPVHKGHISVALSAAKEFAAEKVVFLPERTPYRKAQCTSYEHRLKMLQLATLHNPLLEVLDCPDERQTIASTFGWLKNTFPEHSFIWLVGSDVVGMLSDWPNVEQLQLYGVEALAVAKRGDTQQTVSFADFGIPVRQFIAPDSTVSSSHFRSDSERLKDMAPAIVYEYIVANQLYS